MLTPPLNKFSGILTPPYRTFRQADPGKNDNSGILTPALTFDSGVRKSYLASATGHQYCQMVIKVIYQNTQKLYQLLRLGRMDGSHRRRMQQIVKAELLISDDFGIKKPDELARLDFLEMVKDRNGRKSIIIASQLPSSICMKSSASLHWQMQY